MTPMISSFLYIVIPPTCVFTQHQYTVRIKGENAPFKRIYNYIEKIFWLLLWNITKTLTLQYPRKQQECEWFLLAGSYSTVQWCLPSAANSEYFSRNCRNPFFFFCKSGTPLQLGQSVDGSTIQRYCTHPPTEIIGNPCWNPAAF